jgi:pyruvate/2-oxoglutarate dehydrogenase complex dihydrolipoamide acyltransferase (E2) component
MRTAKRWVRARIVASLGFASDIYLFNRLRELGFRRYAAAAPALLERLGSGDKTRVFPSVRRLLAENPGLDISRLVATGPKGTLTKADIIEALANGPPKAAPVAKEASKAASAALAPTTAVAPAKAPAQSPTPPAGFADATFTEEAPANIRKARPLFVCSLIHNSAIYSNAPF